MSNNDDLASRNALVSSPLQQHDSPSGAFPPIATGDAQQGRNISLVASYHECRELLVIHDMNRTAQVILILMPLNLAFIYPKLTPDNLSL